METLPLRGTGSLGFCLGMLSYTDTRQGTRQGTRHYYCYYYTQPLRLLHWPGAVTPLRGSHAARGIGASPPTTSCCCVTDSKLPADPTFRVPVCSTGSHMLIKAVAVLNCRATSNSARGVVKHSCRFFSRSSRPISSFASQSALANVLAAFLNSFSTLTAGLQDCK